MEELGIKQCKYCLKQIMTPVGHEADEYCNCETAYTTRQHEDLQKKLTSALDKVCGANCALIMPTWEPVSEEVWTMLSETVYAVSHEIVDKANISLSDGTSAKISKSGVERSENVKRRYAD